MTFLGFDVVLHDEPMAAYYAPRDWFERWFTMPWQPLLYWSYVPAEPRLWPPGQVLISLRTIHAYRSEWAVIERELKAKDPTALNPKAEAA